MDKFKKLYKKIIEDGNTQITFNELVYFVEKLGFNEHCNGDHHVFRMDGIPSIINVQPDGKMAKRYQVKQVKNIVTKYKLGGDYDEK